VSALRRQPQSRRLGLLMPTLLLPEAATCLARDPRSLKDLVAGNHTLSICVVPRVAYSNSLRDLAGPVTLLPRVKISEGEA
jgi:hypothetical protein